MATFFLAIIYLAFIGLGLPDSVLGASWPTLHSSLSVPVSYAGILSVMTTAGTILSSFMSGKVTKRYGTGKVTLISVSMTAMALLGFALAPSFWVLLLLTLPLGLGAGSVDAALNGYVALHYEAKHMSWLHSFWGVGATLGPMILSLFLLQQEGWRKGYLFIGFIQGFIVLMLLLTLPLWQKYNQHPPKKQEASGKVQSTSRGLYQLPGVKEALLSFFTYCAVEMTTGLWGASYLVAHHDFSADVAARYVSLYFGGITLGRIFTGFLTLKFSFKTIIRGGLLSILFGIIMILTGLQVLLLPSFLLIGLGCAPVFPGMIHETPHRFGQEHAQSIIGMQMAFAYMGSTFIPGIFGLLAGGGLLRIFPLYLLMFLLMLFFFSERIGILVKRNQTATKKSA